MRSCIGIRTGLTPGLATQTLGKYNDSMSGLLNKAFASPNFAFLMKYDEVLVRHAALAERYVFDDPNSALIKLRQFGELLARHAVALHRRSERVSMSIIGHGI